MLQSDMWAHPGAHVRLGIGFGFNIPLMVWLAIDFPGIQWYLIAVFAGNLFVYSVYYFSMKIIWGERIMITTWLCLLLLVASSVAAILFYNEKEYDFDLTPAESRNLNKPCIIPSLSYDSHNM